MQLRPWQQDRNILPRESFRYTYVSMNVLQRANAWLMGVGQTPSCLREHHGLSALQLTSDVSERNWVSGCQPVSLLPLPTWLSVFLGILGPCCISWQGLQERRCFPGKELRKTPKLDSYILLPILSTDKGYAQGIETENTAKRKISPGKHHLEKKDRICLLILIQCKGVNSYC